MIYKYIIVLHQYTNKIDWNNSNKIFVKINVDTEKIKIFQTNFRWFKNFNNLIFFGNFNITVTSYVLDISCLKCFKISKKFWIFDMEIFGNEIF